MNMNNDTNVVVLTGQVSKIQKVQQGDAFMVELELIVKKKIKTGMKLNRFKVVFFGEEAVDVDRSVTVSDRLSLVGELDEATYHDGTIVAREQRVTGRHMNLPWLKF